MTYLTAAGSPTIVLDCTADTQYCKVTRSDISRAWVSFPSPLKHMSFDGRLLHGAPALTQLAPDAVRVTFLANVRRKPPQFYRRPARTHAFCSSPQFSCN